MARRRIQRTGAFYWKPHRVENFTFWLWWVRVKT